MQPELLALEIAKHLPASTKDMTLEQAMYWRQVTFAMTDDQLHAFIRVVTTFNHPLLLLIREVGMKLEQDAANVQ